jgi:hypothetical protein
MVMLSNAYTPRTPDATYPIEVHLEKHGNSTEYPTHVKLGIQRCTNNTWAFGYANSDAQRLAADSCLGSRESPEFRGFAWDTRSSAQVMQSESMDELCGPDPSTRADQTEDDNDGIVTSYMSPGRSLRSATEFDREQWRLPVNVDLNV